jgi:ATP-dependent protease ClpP protease subunit
MSWWKLIRQHNGAARLCIFNEIGIFEPSIEPLLQELEGLREITLAIDSQGGSGCHALRLYRELRGRCPLAVVTGHCLSAAVIIMLAAERREIVPAGRVMIHGATEAVFGTADFLATRAAALGKANSEFAALISERTGQPADVVAGWFTRDTWFDADEAWHAGLVHEILPQPFTPLASPIIGQPTAAPATQDDGSERLALDLIAALGMITVRDRARFCRNVAALLNQQVHESP